MVRSWTTGSAGAFEPAGRTVAQDWIKVADEAALGDCELLAVYPRGLGLLLARVDGGVYAVANRCAHMACPLEAGGCDGYVLTCPCHDWRFDVRTGACVEAPEIAIPTYPVRVDAGEVFVQLSSEV